MLYQCQTANKRKIIIFGKLMIEKKSQILKLNGSSSNKAENQPANAISGRSGGGNDDETFAAAKNVKLFLNT